MKDKEKKALEYMDKVEAAKDFESKIKFLKKAIKEDYKVLWEDEKVRRYIEYLRDFAALPDPGNWYLSSKEARDFFEQLPLLKRDKFPESRIFFGWGYCLESCLGMKFTPSPKWELVAYDNAALVYFVNSLKEKWRVYCKRIGKFKYTGLPQKKISVIKFCQSLGIEITNNELAWGSLYDVTKLSLTILGIANLKRFEAGLQSVLKKVPSHPLQTVIKVPLNMSEPYFSFSTLKNLYNKAKKEMDSYKLYDAQDSIESAKAYENPASIFSNRDPLD